MKRKASEESSDIAALLPLKKRPKLWHHHLKKFAKTAGEGSVLKLLCSCIIHEYALIQLEKMHSMKILADSIKRPVKLSRRCHCNSEMN